jgi:hypothetical protein
MFIAIEWQVVVCYLEHVFINSKWEFLSLSSLSSLTVLFNFLLHLNTFLLRSESKSCCIQENGSPLVLWTSPLFLNRWTLSCGDTPILLAPLLDGQGETLPSPIV